MTDRRHQLLFFALATIVLLIAGCTAGPYWSWQHPQGLDNLALQRDQSECQALAAAELNQLDYYRPYYLYPWYDKRHSRKGYYRPYYLGPSYDYQRYDFDLSQLARFCLQAKGWQRVRIVPPPQ